MASGISITIDDVLLNDTFYVSEVSRPWPTSVVEHVSVPGRDGEVVTSQQMGPRTVSFRLWHPTNDHQVMYDAFATLVGLLHDGEHTLTLSDESGRSRLVRLDGDLSYDEYMETGSITVSLLQSDPRCYGESRAINVPKNGSASFTTKHDNCDVIIRADAATRRASDDVWGVNIDGEWVIHVVMSSADDAEITIDCAHHSAYVDGTASMLTLDSDWPVLRAGTHTVTMDAASSTTSIAVVEVTERPL